MKNIIIVWAVMVAALGGLLALDINTVKSIRAEIAALDERITGEEAARITAGAALEQGIDDTGKANEARWEEADKAINALREELDSMNAPETAQEPQEEAEEPEAVETTAEGVDTSGWQYIGVKKLTAYEETGHNTASGVYPIEDESCASNELPFGTRLYIEGYGFWTVHDRGNMPWADLDLYLRTYDRCVQFGERTANVWIVK